MKTTKKTSIIAQSFSLWEKVAGTACRMRVIHNITNSHQLKDSSRWSQPASLIGIDHSRLNPLMAISPILIFAFLLPLSFNLLTGATALAVAPTIGLSILATDGNTNNNITIQSPSGGGIAVGRHTLVINTNSYKGYNVTLNSNTSNSNLTSTNGSSNNSNNNIVPVAGTLTNPTSLTVDNTWGVAIPGKPGFGQDSDYTSTNTAAKYAAVPASSTTTNNSILTKTSPSNTAGDNQPVVYGVKTASLTKAGSYKATVTYTATAQLPAKPTITSIAPNSYQLGADIATNPNASKITIAGTDLGSTNEVYIDTNGNSQKDTGEECTNLQVASDTEVTCNVPTASTINSGTYDVTVTAQGGETTLSNGFTYTKAKDAAVCASGDSASACQVDIDANMIPIKYTGNTSSPSWAKADVTKPGDWYDYSKNAKKWANAVTVTSSTLSKYKNAAPGTNIPEADILGYYVYIPRYAYEVMRRDAVDKVVQAQNFDIRFETKDTIKKTPKQCTQSTSSNHVDYRTACGISRDYNEANTETGKNNTTWATHPAFTFGTKELNGIWVGKFETTGSTSAPTIKPNYNHMIAEFAGVAYDVSNSVGVRDADVLRKASNVTTTYNSQGLDTFTSHMSKNSEWGAAVYLSASEYGAGIHSRSSGVQPNNSTKTGEDGNWNTSVGMTGCGPKSDGSEESYDNCNKYNTPIGQLASMTNNVYGIYDMSGGGIEYTAAYNDGIGSGDFFKELWSAPKKLFNVYPKNIFSTTNEIDPHWIMTQCTWDTCGGQALHEVLISLTDSGGDMWCWGQSNCVMPTEQFSWAYKGGYAGNVVGIFVSGKYLPQDFENTSAFRVVLPAE